MTPEETIKSWVGVAQGSLGWRGMANIFVGLNLDRTLLGLKMRSKRKRARVKHTKKILKYTALTYCMAALKEIEEREKL